MAKLKFSVETNNSITTKSLEFHLDQFLDEVVNDTPAANFNELIKTAIDCRINIISNLFEKLK